MVKLYKPKLTILQQEIIRLLFKKTGKILNQRDIARFLEVSQPAVMKSIPLLKKEEIIKINQNKDSKRWEIELNTENYRLMQLKRVNNLKEIYESGLFSFLEKEFAGATIILFGSYSNGGDTINSDIDIAIIGRKDKIIDLSKYENYLEREINLNFYDSLKSLDKNFKENLFNGIVLSGGIEL